MTKAKISEYDAVASNNTDVNGVNIAEGCPPSGMNNMGREIMAALKRFQVGSDGDGVTVGGNLVVSGSSTLSTTSISSADINAGTIDGTAIGGSTPAAGSFTTLNTSGAVVFNDAGADVDFRVESDTVENALFVDGATGEVLVGGTTSLNSAGGVITLKNPVSGTGAPYINLFRDDTSISSTNDLGIIRWFGNDTTSNTPTELASIYAEASGTHGAGDNPTDLVFGCTNDGSSTVAEFGRIGQTGTTGRKFEMSQATLTDNQPVRFTAYSGTAGTLNRYISVGTYKHSGITNSCAYIDMDAEDGANNVLWVDNSDILRISTTHTNIGTTGGTVVGTQTSDERLKDISGPVSYGLNEVLAIEPIAFTMKDDPSIPKIGFSAQQVQPIVPEAVYDTKECIDGYTENEETKEQIANSDRTKLAMEYTQLIPVLVNAVKELKAITDTQAQTISALEARIAALENA